MFAFKVQRYLNFEMQSYITGPTRPLVNLNQSKFDQKFYFQKN